MRKNNWKLQSLGGLVALSLACSSLSACSATSTPPVNTETTAKATEQARSEEASEVATEVQASEGTSASSTEITDGTYSAVGTGFSNGEVPVTITVEGGKITNVDIDASTQTDGYGKTAADELAILVQPPHAEYRLSWQWSSHQPFCFRGKEYSQLYAESWCWILPFKAGTADCSS